MSFLSSPPALVAQVHYQPIVFKGRRQAIAWSEALARIEAPDGYLCSPGPLLASDKSGSLEQAIDLSVLPRIRADMARIPTLRVSVNASPRSLSSRVWQGAFQTLLDVPGASRRVVLEVTERGAIDHCAKRGLEELRAQGVLIALDDISADCASLEIAKALRPDILKIDRATTQAWLQSRTAALPSICGLADAIGAHVVAEGVEENTEALRLTAHGIPFLQGYFFGRPCAPSE